MSGSLTVQDRLARDILSGRLSPGSKLKLAEISEVYTSGISPLREALSNLAGQGLVLQEGQKGFRVAEISLDDLKDIIGLRSRLEVMALGVSVDDGDIEWEAKIISSFHRLKRHERTREQLIDEEWESLHFDFHMGLIGACGSPRLHAFCGNLLQQFDRYRRISAVERGSHASLKPLDEKVVEAALARDKSHACSLLSEHISEAGQGMCEFFEKRASKQLA